MSTDVLSKPIFYFITTMRYFLISVCLIIIQNTSTAQYNNSGPRLELGLAGGCMFYLGDVNKEKLFYDIHPAFGGMARYNINSRIAIRLTGVFGKVSADDADFESVYQQLRDYRFEANITDINLQLEINFLTLVPDDENLRWTPFVSGGFGAFILSGDDVKSLTKMSIPFGVGFKYCPSERLSLGIEWGMRTTFTDEIDGLTEDYKSTVESIVANKQKTFMENNDSFSYAGIFISYKFASTNYACPAFRGNPSKNKKN